MTTIETRSAYLNKVVDHFIITPAGFVDNNLKFELDVKKKDLRNILNSCIKFYCPDNDAGLQKKAGLVEAAVKKTFCSIQAVAKTASNMALSMVSCSYWADAKRALLPLSRDVIANHIQFIDKEYMVVENNAALQKKADALSEFIIRYLITCEEEKKNRAFSFISEKEWYGENILNLTITEIVERAINGYGIHLPKHTVDDLIKLLRVEKAKLSSDIQKSQKIISSSTLDVLSSSNLLKVEIRRMLYEYEECLNEGEWIERLDVKLYLGTSDDLLHSLNTLREIRNHLQKSLNALRVIFCKVIDPAPQNYRLYLSLLSFTRLRLKSLCDRWELFLEKHPDSTYYQDPKCPSILELSYDYHSACKQYQHYKFMYEKMGWIDDPDASWSGKPVEEFPNMLHEVLLTIKTGESQLESCYVQINGAKA